MPATKTKALKRHRGVKTKSANERVSGKVLTLHEAAAYLRVPQTDVLEMVNEQGLPGRQIGREWRFLQSALEDWLRMPANKSNKDALLAMVGQWKDDPYLDEMLGEIYKHRGRPMTEESE